MILLLINCSKFFLSNLVSDLPNRSSIFIGRASFDLLSNALLSSEIFGRRASDIPILSTYFRSKPISFRDIFLSVIMEFLIFLETIQVSLGLDQRYILIMIQTGYLKF